MNKYDRVECLSVATRQAIKNLKIRRSPSGVWRPTPEQLNDIRAIKDNWTRAFLKILSEE